MTTGPARAAVGPLALVALGTLMVLSSALFDPLRGRPLDYGLPQCALGWLGLVVALEGLTLRGGRSFPALWTTLTAGGRAGTLLTLLIAGTLGAFLLHLFRAYAADDSFITYRFAKNLARGAGVTWNPGEPPVEGYSNFLWMLLSAGAIRGGLDPLLVSRVAAILCYGGCLFALRTLALRAGASAGHANLPVLLFAAVPAFAYWAMSGLETLSVVLLALLYLIALAREADPRALPWRSALMADLLLLSRPDTPLLIALAVVPLLAPFDRARRAWLIRLVLLALPVAALYLGWKGATFHRLFANTVAAKLHVLAGLTLVTGFFAYAFPWLAALTVAVARGSARVVERQTLLVAAAFGAALLNAASPVGHYYRFFLPVLAPMLASVAPLADRARLSEGARGRVVPAILCLLTMAYTLAPLYVMVDYAKREAEGLERAHVTVARLLKRNFGPDRLLAASDCGVLPYLSEMRTIDIWGLTDRTIAERGFEVGYVMGAKPDAVVLHSLHPGVFTGRHAYDRELHEALTADPAYRLAGQWEFFGYWLWVYSRKPLV
jgi:hypothetical protein